MRAAWDPGVITIGGGEADGVGAEAGPQRIEGGHQRRGVGDRGAERQRGGGCGGRDQLAQNHAGARKTKASIPGPAGPEAVQGGAGERDLAILGRTQVPRVRCRQAPRHAGASRGPRRPAHRAEAVPAGVGEPEPEGPVTGVPEEPDAVSGYDRRTGEPGRGSESLAESYRIPAPVPGIGPVTAASPVAWTGGPGATASRQAAAPGGVAPIARDSGTLRGGRHMGGGRRRPGDVPYMAAMAACMSGPEMKALYGRLRERAGHPGSL